MVFLTGLGTALPPNRFTQEQGARIAQVLDLFPELAERTKQHARTLSGGQYSIEVESFLAVENGAAPDLVIEATHGVAKGQLRFQLRAKSRA